MKISNLSVSLNETPLIKNLSLTIEPGTFHIITGKNGSGKSSLAATLMGHPAYTVTQGTIELNGEDITTLSPDKRAQRGLYLALQYPPALPGISVATFLQEALRAVKDSTSTHLRFAQYDRSSEEITCALEAVGLPAAYAHRAMHDGFSGGEKKRLELAQILVLKPTTIILDEIDSGLDAQGIDCVQKIITQIRTERPETRFVYITHNPMLVQALQPDFVHVMQDGTLEPPVRRERPKKRSPGGS